ARNAFIDRVRKTKRAEVDLSDPMLIPEHSPAPDAGLDATDRNEALNDAINALPTDQSEVLCLVYFSGMRQQAIAEKLSIPLNTVKSRLRLALEKLRRLMEHA
ncbi:MAG: sigma-70 family RNA polymerase sigma factor, partial [Pseudomonadota bacterium]